MFKKGQSGNPNGRTPGSKNRLTGAHGDLVAAWDKVSGPETARKLMKSALDEALGREEPILDEKGAPVLDKKGKPKVKKWAPNFEPIRTLLPYVARKMPDTIELGPIETMTPEEIDALWEKKQDRPSGPAK